MEIEVGSAVRSKAGRDKGAMFIVIRREGDYAYIADGDTRRVEKPKKKKTKHLQGTNYVFKFIADRSESVGAVTNSEVRKALTQTGGNNIG